MKRLIVLATALLFVSIASAQINTVVVNTRGDVTLRQGDVFSCSGGEYISTDGVLYLNGSDDYSVTVEELNSLTILSSGDVTTDGIFHGKDLSIAFNSSGDSKLDLNYDHIYVMMIGSGDLVLRGHCDVLDVDHTGSGDLDAKDLMRASQNGTVSGTRAIPNMAGLSDLLYELGVNLERLADSVDWDSFASDMERWGEGMEEWGRHMEEWGEEFERRMEGKTPRDRQESDRQGRDKPHYGPQPKDGHFPGQKPTGTPKPKSLLFDPHWCGVDAGLNMLITPGFTTDMEWDYSILDLKPLKSWNFNFNIADVGIAFSRSHIAGLYTGIGLGWNNYSLNNPVRLVKGDQRLLADWVDETVEGRVKKSKLGVLYVQMPLMIEVRPTRGFFVAAGVTGGLRVDTWTKIKFSDRYSEKNHSDYYVNPLKLDAVLRAGSNDLGFYASYNLLPLFRKSYGPEAHTLNIGFSLLF